MKTAHEDFINYSVDGLSLAIMKIRRIMKARGCTPIQIAEAVETMCKWCGIKLPENFVNRNQSENFIVTLMNGQQFPCRDGAEVVDMITAFRLVEKLKKKGGDYNAETDA